MTRLTRAATIVSRHGWHDPDDRRRRRHDRDEQARRAGARAAGSRWRRSASTRDPVLRMRAQRGRASSTTTSRGSRERMVAPHARRRRGRPRCDAGRRAAAPVRLPGDDDEDVAAIVNPEIIERGEGAEVDEEGLPLAPGRARCRSSARVDVTARRARSSTGAPLRLELDELAARVVAARARPPRRRADHRPHRPPRRAARRSRTLRPRLVLRGSRRGADRRRRHGAVRRRRARAARRPPRGRGAADAARPRRAAGAARSPRRPAKVVAERLGIPVLQPERPTAGARLLGATVVVVAPTGCLIPDDAARAGAVAQRPPVAAARAGGAPRPSSARSWPAIAETGRDDPRDRQGARRRPDRRAASVSRSTPDDDAGVVYARAADARGRAARRRARRAGRLSCRRRDDGVTYAGQDRARRPRARPRGACRGARATGSARSRRTSARAPSCTGGRVTIWRARVGGRASFVPVEVQPEGGKRMHATTAWLRGLR